jgi:hypothetical protein
MKFVRHPGDPQALERFLGELRILARLDHPNIVRVLASDFLRADPYFTMEYLAHGSLSQVVKTDGPLPPAKAVRLVRVIADALGAAHAKQVIHRDLKPSNILLTPDGTPKVADFGLAKHLDEVDPITRASGTLGTPNYMPPEQVSRKNGAIGPWSDVYGLGATLYHLLTGRAPFVGDTSAEIVYQVLADPPTRPRALYPEIPLALEGIVVKCLEKDPKDRYQTIAELAADLDRFTAGKVDPLAPQLTRARRARRWVRRHRGGVAAVVGTVLLLVGAFALGAANAPKPEPPAPDYWVTARTELAAGRSVTLVPETGDPLRWEWRLGAAPFGPSPTGDGSCYFETVDRALLDLLDDPGIDRYRIRADLRQVRRAGAPNAEAPREDESAIGVFFGRATRAAPNGDTVHAFFRVSFHDFDPKWGPGEKVNEQSMQFQRVLSVTGPQRPALEPNTTFAGCPFLPVVRRPGNWYTIEIDVTPEEIAARWITKDGPKPLTGVPPIKPVVQYAKLQATVNGLPPPPTGVTLPQWTPRMPLGLSVGSSAITVRNVTITPLPPPSG